MEVCECTKCKYCGRKDNKCRFGLRDVGCYMENKTVKSMSNDWLASFTKGITPEE